MKNKKLLLGVSGGIAIYKSLELLSMLKKDDWDLTVIMTESASRMISPILFETMGRCKVYTDTFVRDDNKVLHIDLTKDADLFLIAPATANIMAKCANGIADDLLSTTLLASYCPIVFAPTMNTRMLDNPATVENMKKLRERGSLFIDSSDGFLACNEVGKGRMAEAREILDHLNYLTSKKDLQGKKIIVTAGPTIEEIDPVRYIANRSSGKQGYELALNARNRGAEVVLVMGQTHLEKLKGAKNYICKTNEEMKNAIAGEFEDADALIMASAPMDFKIDHYSPVKIKKTSDFSLKLKKNIDILSHFGKIKKGQVLIGFAAETNNLEEYARKKLEDKNLDYIVANDVSKEGAGFGSETNIASIISKDEKKDLPKMLKSELANVILDKLV